MNATPNSMETVLVLEDDQDARKLCNKLLTMKTGAEVECAGSVDEIEEWDYDLTITDYTGIDVDTVYENSDEIILYTGHDKEFLDVPENVEYLQKGGGYNDLVDTVENKLN